MFAHCLSQEKNHPYLSTLKKLSIAGVNFNQDLQVVAQQLYDRFVNRIGQPQVPTITKDGKNILLYDINGFIEAIIQAHANNFSQMEQNLDAIEFLAASIFGKEDAANIRDDLLKEIKLATKKTRNAFINEANQKTEEEKEGQKIEVSRINNPNGEEKRRLQRLYDADKQLKIQILHRRPVPPTPSKPSKEKWEYKRFKKGEERELPESDYVKDLTRLITIDSPEILEQMNKQDLVNLIRKNIEGNFQLLESRGITRRQLGEWVIGKISDFYPSFATYIKNKYQIEIPIYPQKISVIPISGKLGKIINPEKKAAGFITGISPTIFLDLDVLIEKSYELLGEDLRDKKINEITQEKLNNYLKRVVSEMGPHELCHLLSDLGLWQKEDDYFLGKIGVEVAKPIGEEIIDGQTLPKFYQRGETLNEAITHQLVIQWAKDNNLIIDFPGIYDWEREVLYELVRMVAKENQIAEDQAFSYFAKALFGPEDFRRLIELLDGHKKTPEGRFITKRPSFTPILYFIMNWEKEKIRKRYEKGERNLHYDLTLGLIRGNLTEQQKKEIQLMLQTFPSYPLSPAARKELERIV